jgi:hypothetical protein
MIRKYQEELNAVQGKEAALPLDENSNVLGYSQAWTEL